MQRIGILRDIELLLTSVANEFCAARLEAGAYSRPDSWPAEPEISDEYLGGDYYDGNYIYPDGMDEISWRNARAASARQVQSFECLWLEHNKRDLLQYVSCSKPVPKLQYLGPELAKPSLMSVVDEILLDKPTVALVAGLTTGVIAVMVIAGGWRVALAAGAGFFVLSALVLVSSTLVFELRAHNRELRRRELIDRQNRIVQARVEDEITMALGAWEPPNSDLQPRLQRHSR